MHPNPDYDIAVEWSDTGEILLNRYGNVRGTQIFLNRLLNDPNFKRKIAIVSSFGTESAVLLAIVADANPHTPVISVDTGFLFTVTEQYRKLLVRELGLTDLRIAGFTRAEIESFNPEGTPPTCCGKAKKAATERATEGRDYVTGRKGNQGGERSNLGMTEFSGGKTIFNPLAKWTKEEIQAEMIKRNLPRHPLEAKGFASVGCWTCTRPGKNRDESRVFADGSTECGMHRKPEEYTI